MERFDTAARVANGAVAVAASTAALGLVLLLLDPGDEERGTLSLAVSAAPATSGTASLLGTF
jgi:hypothetical protein